MTEILIVPNVSCVPIYSPLRYPGGKSRLYPFVTHWIKNLRIPVYLLVEPFAGAAHIGLASVIEGTIPHVILVEKDEDIASVWRTIFSDDCEWLIERIVNFELSDENANIEFNQTHVSMRERAFKVLLRNRVSRSGISAPGAGILGGGENGKGIHSRWYPDTLSRRLATIFQARERVQFIEGDGLEVIRKYSHDERAVFFVDPPYPNSGRRLYKCYDVSPDIVFQTTSMVRGDFLITYDDSEEIIELAKTHQLQWRRILVQTAHHRKKFELLIGRDLNWTDNVRC